MIPSDAEAPQSFIINPVARRNASSAISGRNSLSNRYEASVFSPRAVLVDRVLAPLKLADSRNILEVDPSISVLRPPIIPARPIASF